MAVPYLAGALKGWTSKIDVEIVTGQNVVDFETIDITTPATLDCNFQPMPSEKVNRKPEEQRTWKWWSLIVKKGPYLATDSIFIVDNIKYRVVSGNNWTQSGFQKYECLEEPQ